MLFSLALIPLLFIMGKKKRGTEVCKTSLMIDNEAIARGRGRPVSESRLVILEALRLKFWNTWGVIP